MMGGFAGNVLHVDLTRREVRKAPLDPDLAKLYAGGLGLCIKLAADHLTPGADPLSPDNAIVLGAGPLVGTDLPAASRVYAVTKLPQSGTLGWCGGGGVNFGCQLKNAGYDHLIIKGQADSPVYLSLHDDEVRIEDAGRLWGRGVAETCASLGRGSGPPPGVLAIGPAGENRVRFSMAFIDRVATLGRGGFGAVMGAKNLKAIVVRGGKGLGVADKKRYVELRDELLARIKAYPFLKEWQELGLVKSLPLVPREVYRQIKVRRLACVSCPIADKDLVRIPDGEFAGTLVGSTSAVNLFIPMIYGMSDYREAIRLTAALDDLGLDIFEFLGLMKFAASLVERGLLPGSGVQPEINLGSLDSMLAWAGKVAGREGLGALLAEGAAGMLRELGEEAAELAPPLIKNMMPYVGPQAPLAWNWFGTMELGQVLDPRGPHVGASGSPTYFAKRPLEVFPQHLARMGASAEAIERILPGRGSPLTSSSLKLGTLLKYSHAWFVTLGSLGLCARAQINRWYDADACAALYSAVTGTRTAPLDLREGVDRAWTLLRLVNLREGLRPEAEAVPGQWFKDPAFRDYLTGERVQPEDVEQMKRDYFREWGWDQETGTPQAETLTRLGLQG